MSKKSKIEKSNLKELVLSNKIISIFAIIMHYVFIISLLAFTVYTIIEIKSVGYEKIVNNEVVSKFIETTDIIKDRNIYQIVSDYKSSIGFTFFEVIIPSIIILIVLASLTLFWKYVYKLFKNVKNNNDLFTDGKLELLKRMKNIITLSFLVIVILVNINFVIVWAITELVMEFIIYIFEYALRKTKDKQI